MSKVRIFVSFDVEHDWELYELLLVESRAPNSGFEVLGGSERSATTEVGSERVRRRIREADQMIVLCGEHTEASTRVGAELRLAQEEGIPYFLLWGRREIMCTKPIGAKPVEGMYSWTQQILHEQITFTHRNADADAAAEARGDETRKRSAGSFGGSGRPGRADDAASREPSAGAEEDRKADRRA